MPSNIDVASYLTEMLLFAISANLGYLVFTNSNEKFISVFHGICHNFQKIRCHRPHFYKSSYRLENCHAKKTSEPDSMLFTLAL